MEQLTRDEIEMCQIAVSHVAEYKLNNNKEKWNTLWDKLEHMQRDCLTPRALDGAICRHDFAVTDDVLDYCIVCGETRPAANTNR